MQTWTTYKQAALEYAKWRPRRVVATITLVADTTSYTLPADCLRVLFVAWGEESTFTEVATASVDNTVQGWAAEGGLLYLTPAPTTDDVTDPGTIKIVYYGRYMPNEGPQTFTPALPAADTSYVDDLEQAILLDLQADDISGGPVIYTVGQTQVDREGAIADLRQRALQLRTRVQAALDEPLAIWS